MWSLLLFTVTIWFTIHKPKPIWKVLRFDVTPSQRAIANISCAGNWRLGKADFKVDTIPLPVSAHAISTFDRFPLATIIDFVSSTACSQKFNSTTVVKYR